MSVTRFNKIQQVLNTRQPDLTVMLENVVKPHNLAAIARTCDAVGIQNIHAVTQLQGLRLSQQAAGGVRKWLQLHRYTNTADAYHALKQQGLTIVATHLSDKTQDYASIDFTRPTAIIAGSEFDGISEYAIEHADHLIAIPMTGMVQSLNVSVAMSVILFEAMRQRRVAGMYDQRRLDEATYQRLLFEWAHPKISQFCREHNEPYPRIDENGHIIKSRPKT